MPNYKEMYLIMVRAAEHAQNILIEAQQKCEELYIEEEQGTVLRHQWKLSKTNVIDGEDTT